MRSFPQVSAYFAILVSTFVGSACDSTCPVGTHQVGGICKINTEPQSDAGQNANGSQGLETAGNTNTKTGSQGAISGSSAASSTNKAAVGGTMSTIGVSGTNGAPIGNLTAGAGMATAGLGSALAGQAAAIGTSGSAGTSSVQNGAMMPSTPNCSAMGPEECDGKDNDCDSVIDESIAPRACGGPTMGIGECVAGKEECTAGAWSGSCVGEVKPTQERCDAAMKDEDCDGKIDNGCPCTTGQMRKCSTPPSCKEGVQTCENGVWGSECAGEIKGSAEKCDGEDNDCNGTRDDGGDSLCPGKRCAGSTGCVDCMSDTDCRNRSAPACKVNYCDTSRHTCAAKDANNGTSCGNNRTCSGGNCVACANANDCDDKTCQNKACSGGECVYTPVRTGDSPASCSGGKVCGASHTCVGCVNDNDCGDKTCQTKKCSGSGECTYTPVRLGDPHSSCSTDKVCSANQTCVECVGGAQCSSRGPGAWVCASNICKITEPTMNCTGREGFGCSPSCSTKSDCITSKPELVTCASNSSGSWCQYSCQNNNSDCPSGFYCGTFICLHN